MTMELAGDRPPRYDKKRLSLAIVRARAIQRSRGTGPRATGTLRPGGLSYGGASRPEVSPTAGMHRDRAVSPTGRALIYETPSINMRVFHKSVSVFIPSWGMGEHR